MAADAEADHAIRAVVLSRMLQLIKNLPERDAKTVIRGLGPDCAERAAKAGQLQWLPGADMLAFMDATVDNLGPVHARTLWRQLFDKVVTTNLLKPIAHAAQIIFGGSPAGLVLMSPKGWSLVAKNLGTFSHRVGDDDDSAVLSLDDYPRFMCNSGTFATALAGCFEGYYSLTKVTGTVEVKNVDQGLGRAEFHFAWQSAGAR